MGKRSRIKGDRRRAHIDPKTGHKIVPLSPEAVAVLKEQRQRFVEKFGREPGPDDPVFFDLPHTERLEAEAVEAMKKAGLPPALVYAFEKTGHLIVEGREHLFLPEEVEAFFAAQQEWHALQRKA